jgi:outer membrane protein TolC
LATLELKNARAAIASYEQSLYMRLRTASLNAKLAKEQLVVATQIEKQASEYFGIVSEQYNVGKASSLERTDAQVAWTGAKASTVAATYDYQDALAVIAQLTGDFPEYHPEDVTKPDFE